MLLQSLFEKSGTKTAEEFIEVFKNSQKLRESLLSHQSLGNTVIYNIINIVYICLDMYI
jgi:hypothetical protein